MNLELRLCGELELRRAGQVVPLPPSVKTRGLLAYLVMNEREHRRQQLVELLWDVADDPRGGLRWSLSKLRSLLDDIECTRILADRESIRIETARIDIDARAILSANIEQAGVVELEALCARVRGEFCAGIELQDLYGFHAWCVGQRQDLRRRHARMRERLVRLLGDRPDAALPHSRALCQLSPDREGVHAEHVRLLRALGDVREAGEYRRAARDMLAQQYGLHVLPLLDGALDGALDRPPEPDASAAPTAPSSPAGHEPPRQHIRFCKSADGVGIAYAEVGSGPTLVKAANWISHLEHEFRSPVWCHLIRELSRARRLVRYDQRGNGLSDRKVTDVSLARHVDDLEAVMDAAGCERAPLLGISQGCAIAIAYAARYPERVSHLVLYGGFALGWNRHNDGVRAAGQALATMTRSGWGQPNPAFRQVWTSLFIPHGSPEAIRSFNEMQRVACDGETAARLVLAVGDMDVGAQLAAIRCPTLVVHLEDDQIIPIAEGKRMAGGIPGSLFVSLPGENHIPLERDPCFPQLMVEIDRFLTDSR